MTKKKHDFDERQQQIVNAQMAKCVRLLYLICWILIAVGQISEWISGKAWFSIMPWFLVASFISYFLTSNSQATEIIEGLEELDEQQLPQYLQRRKKTSLLEGVGISVVLSASLYWGAHAPIEFAVFGFVILALVISYGLYVIDKQKAQKYVQRLNEK